MDQWLEEIRAALPELVVYQQEPMKKHTTFRVGGPAAVSYTHLRAHET